jgi:alginate O-acetyltransferase complex protein AlgI
MLFNSYGFVLLFLPLTLAVYALASSGGRNQLGLAWLAVSSLVFYGWADSFFVWILFASISINFSAGLILGAQPPPITVSRRFLVGISVAANLLLLAQFKYVNFGIEILESVLARDLAPRLEILPPLAISFFTFQQIAYVVDAYRGGPVERNLLRYVVFVSFFPQLIAGPIVHHREVLPQLADPRLGPSVQNLARGLTLFAIGLFKKVVIADGIVGYVTPVFDSVAGAAHAAASPSFVDAWGGALAYSLQLYFDFSGYCDMAIGLGILFGIRLPENFDSPYKADSISDFWRRWHITLSRFLRDYLYIPLGGNRGGSQRRAINLMLTMLLGGLWHGAGWTFVVWGGLHGFYLVVNHAWRSLVGDGKAVTVGGRSRLACSRALTLLAIVVAWVFFRADSLAAALSILHSMSGVEGFSGPRLLVEGIDGTPTALFGALDALALAGLWIAVLVLPNSREIMSRAEDLASAESTIPASSDESPWIPRWSPSAGWAITVGAMMAISLAGMHHAREFVYFRF